VKGGIGAPGAPALRPLEQLTRRRPAALLVGQGAQQADIGGRKGVALAQAAHGDVLRRPFADAGQVSQLDDRILEGASRVEQAGIA
jgi:hypothetical protein